MSPYYLIIALSVAWSKVRGATPAAISHYDSSPGSRFRVA